MVLCNALHFLLQYSFSSRCSFLSSLFFGSDMIVSSNRVIAQQCSKKYSQNDVKSKNIDDVREQRAKTSLPERGRASQKNDITIIARNKQAIFTIFFFTARNSSADPSPLLVRNSPVLHVGGRTIRLNIVMHLLLRRVARSNRPLQLLWLVTTSEFYRRMQTYNGVQI